MRHGYIRQNKNRKTRAWTASGALLFSVISGVITFLAARRRRQQPQGLWRRIKSAAA